MEKKFLAEKEVHRIRPLWETVFTEDSKEFTDYYFTYKAEQNLVFIREAEGTPVSMLHLTPYLTGKLEPVCYIVGVATDEKYRRQGLMAELLKESLQFMWEEHQPFTFLMPANPAYYSPFGFSYIYDKPVWKINENILPLRYLDAASANNASFHLVIKNSGNWQLRCGKNCDYKKVADFAESVLKKQADCYMLRSPHYYKQMQEELRAQNGYLFVLEQNGEIKGLLSYVHENGKPGLQEVILDEDARKLGIVTAEECKPAIMARVIRPECFLKGLGSKGPVELYFKVEDELLSGNKGVYHAFTKDGNMALCCEKIPEAKFTGEVDCVITAEDLTQFGFGRISSECFKRIDDKNVERIQMSLSNIVPWGRVFINEIV
ncbi:MAG: GNAT family N-acetyltransferase [Lachnospiraceae bacterium]|nr:GNAT family N-acetyltransferase [Lachnospiraceae bacterium]